ncbi:sigma-70 family RNA polymerase sigma factor [Corynebacterium sphenisci]|uniref:sigma-70 family RNA polymerase sigma factor n=1 Tax=Corynebacterium sphenisci TaxID=191493 RepID=UPI0009534B52|nr:sigma-70 family RNA polymerase sigma factor [Corynebacterium sphenisci]
MPPFSPEPPGPNPAAPARPDDAGAAELVHEVAAGDRAAFARLYDLYGSRVYGMALRVVGDPALAEDVAQDTWLSVWDSAAGFRDGRGSVAGWLLAIAHRRAVDAVRAIEAGRRRADRAAQLDAAIVADDPADAGLLRAEERGTVAWCLEQLTARQREVLELAYFRGLTQSQIATRLSIGVSAVKSRVRDGMVAMRRCLGA